MASAGEEVELIQGGMKANVPHRGSFYQNLHFKQGEWVTRPGFGQVAQFDSTLGDTTPESEVQLGYGEPLGSHAFLTNFGHLQVVTVLPLFAFTGNTRSLYSQTGRWANLIAVSVYDYSTDSRWEVVLHRHTSEMNEAIHPMRDWHGVYQSASDADYEDWLVREDDVWFFHEFNDSLFFGSHSVGLFNYLPSDFMGVVRRQQIDGSKYFRAIAGYGESCLIRRVSASPGAVDKLNYVDAAAYPRPIDVTDWDGRLLLAGGRLLWFSDRGTPSSILGPNWVRVPGDSEIVAVHRCRDGVLIFFDREVWLYTPNLGNLNNNGRMVQISDGVGVSSSRAVVSSDDKVFWCDRNGVYVYVGGLQYERISEDIEPFFHDFLSNPLSSYFVDEGFINAGQLDPLTVYDYASAGEVSLSFDPVDRHLLLTCPDLGITFVWMTGVWSIWNYQSVSNLLTDTVGATSSLPSPQLVCAAGVVFAVCGQEVMTPVDAVGEFGPLIPGEEREQPIGSYFICELGRGGGLERSVESFEDRRLGSGSYVLFDNVHGAGDGQGSLYFGEPMELGPNYKFPSGQVKSNCVLVPVSVVLGAAMNERVQVVQIEFIFDNEYWKPVQLVASPYSIELVFPPERFNSHEAWGLKSGTAPVGGTSEARVYDVASGTLSRDGNQARLHWNGTDAALYPVVAGSSAPHLNVAHGHVEKLFFFPFERLQPTSSNDAIGFGYRFGQAEWRCQPGVSLQVKDFDVFRWVYSSLSPDRTHSADDSAYPVDWAALPGAFAHPSKVRILFRSLYMRVKSFGQSQSPIYPNSTFGLLNVVIGGDSRSWSSQVIDFAGGAIQSVFSVNSIRTRIQTAALAMSDVVFNLVGKWGSMSDPTKGNLLIADDPVNDIAVSDAVAGADLDVMMFGHVRNRAERLGVSSAILMYRVRGGRRRRGR